MKIIREAFEILIPDIYLQFGANKLIKTLGKKEKEKEIPIWYFLSIYMNTEQTIIYYKSINNFRDWQTFLKLNFESFTFMWFFKGSIRLKWILHFGQALGKGVPFLDWFDEEVIPKINSKHIIQKSSLFNLK